MNPTNPTINKAILIFGISVLLFIWLKPKLNKTGSNASSDAKQPESKPDRKKLKEPTGSAADLKDNERAGRALTALKIYIAAYNANETQAKLDELNRELVSQYGMRIYTRKTDGYLVVADTSGNDIIVNEEKTT